MELNPRHIAPGHGGGEPAPVIGEGGHIGGIGRVEGEGVGEIHGPVGSQAEGGAGLNASLLDADLIDELDLTWSPHLVGGGGPRIADGAGEALRRYTLAHLLADDEGFVFSRWTRAC